jgi:hypothetical protein
MAVAATHPERDDPANLHRRLAVELFNEVWTYLEKPDRSAAEDDTMIHAAHASRHHWGIVGTSVNLARGEWQVSRVYAVLGRAEPAIYHAQRCLEICVANGIGDFDIAFAHEALARANAVGGDPVAAAEHLSRARELAEHINEDDDREILLDDLATIPIGG